MFRNYPPRNNTIVAFGDSLIAGRGATEGNDFVSVLARKLKRPIINMGVPGNTTADGLARIGDVLSQHPGTVIVLLGGNDYLQNIPIEQTFANLRKIVETLQEDHIFVILLGVQGGVFSDSYKASFKTLADNTDVVFVPNVLGGIFAHPEFLSDTVHPNDTGYAKIADKVYNIIGGYFW